MPDIFLYPNRGQQSDVLRPYVQEGGRVSRKLMQATATVFLDLPGPKAVSVRMVVSDAEDNVPSLHIVGIANKTPERAAQVEEFLQAWRLGLALAWTSLTEEVPELERTFPLNEVTISTTMPDGRWGRVSEILVALGS